ncbi:MAG: ATP synthase subunit I [bacterium]
MMMMNDTLGLLLALLAGMILGFFYFGGLWLTIKKGLASTRPALWFMGSMLLRTALALLGFYLIGHDHWERLLACVLGFIIMRFVVSQLTRGTQQRTSLVQETNDVPHNT